MSGSIGAHRIKREQVKPTVIKFEQQVLKQFPNYIKYEITGSYNAGIKKDHGDIDLCILINSDKPLKDIKKEFKEYIELNSYCTNFEFGKNVGKKAQMYGSIVTCQVPIVGNELNNVQIDCIIVQTDEQLDFQKHFLDLNGQTQSLYSALVRVLSNENKNKVFTKFGILNLDNNLQKNQEYEFVLSSNSLSLRLITLDQNYKTINKKDIWKSYNWDYVIDLVTLSLNNINPINKTFEELVNLTYNSYKNDDRAKTRIIGIIKSIINIGPGEVNTIKGLEKQNSIDLIINILKNAN